MNFKCKIHAQLELELCLQGQHGSKCSSRLCHTHTLTHTQCCLVRHEQLPLFAFWLHCEYIFVCCLNIKSACHIYNWSIYICTRQIRKVYLSPCVCVCGKCVSVCVHIRFPGSQRFSCSASFALHFSFSGLHVATLGHNQHLHSTFLHWLGKQYAAFAAATPPSACPRLRASSCASYRNMVVNK